MFQYKTLPEKPYIFALLENRLVTGYGSRVEFDNGNMVGNCEVNQVWDEDGKTVVIGRRLVPFEVKKQYHVVIPCGESINGVPASSLILILDEANPYLRQMLNFKGSREFMEMRSLTVRQHKQIIAKDLQLDQLVTKTNEFYLRVGNVMADLKIASRGAKQTTGVQESMNALMQQKSPEATIE